MIVFVSPSVLLIIGVLTGLSYFSSLYILPNVKSLSAIGILGMALALLFAAYEYGRMAEALSATAVSHLLSIIVRVTRKKQNVESDAFRNMTDQVDLLPLPVELAKKRKGTRWPIYFFALLYSPTIGSDLLKRYAWEKLARSSAFTFLLLFLTSLAFEILGLFGIKTSYAGDYGFGTIGYTLFSLLLAVLTYYEFYQRNSWNNDLLIKILPIVLLASKGTADSSKSPKPGSPNDTGDPSSSRRAGHQPDEPSHKPTSENQTQSTL